MATVTRLYFQAPDYSASYDYNDQTLKLTAVHVTNNTGATLTIEVRQSSDDSLVVSHDFAVGQSDLNIPAGQQHTVTLTPQGKVSNLYAKTV